MTASTSSTPSTSTKIPSSSKSSVTKQTKQKRNERERKRVDQVNQGFVLLQERVPKAAGNKAKLSKVETLREAARYIQELQKQLGMSSTSFHNSMPADFPTPEQSPVYPQSVCSMMAQTPSPSYTSPYYPPPQMMSSNQHDMSSHYYQESSSSSASTSGDHHSFYSHYRNFINLVKVDTYISVFFK
nr:basic helix-loop-helix DNA binding protein HLH-3 [Caenorhabditis elegans]